MAAFHYQSSIMWRPPAGLAGGHLCTVRSTAQAIHATSKQFSRSYASLNPSRLPLATLKGCWTSVCSDCLDISGLQAAGRRVSQREDVTGLPTAILARAAAEAAGSSCPATAVVAPACSSAATLPAHFNLRWRVTFEIFYHNRSNTSDGNIFVQRDT